LVRDLKKIIHEYYSELARAYRTKEFNPAKLHLDDDANLIGVSEFFEGKKEIIKMFNNSIYLIQEQNIQHQYFDHESCCAILNNRSTIPEIYLKTTERIVVRHGYIVEIYVLYDVKAWQNLMQLLQSVNSATSFFDKKHQD
jgi:hypothetical protein